MVDDRHERAAKAIQSISGGLNYDYMDFCRDAAEAAVAAYTSTPDAELSALRQRVKELEGVLQRAIDIARSHATCGCNGKHGACMVDDLANQIADDLATLSKGADSDA